VTPIFMSEMGVRPTAEQQNEDQLCRTIARCAGPTMVLWMRDTVFRLWTRPCACLLLCPHSCCISSSSGHTAEKTKANTPTSAIKRTTAWRVRWQPLHEARRARAHTSHWRMRFMDRFFSGNPVRSYAGQS